MMRFANWVKRKVVHVNEIVVFRNELENGNALGVDSWQECPPWASGDRPDRFSSFLTFDRNTIEFVTQDARRVQKTLDIV
jgi:hypothetical protein